MRFTKGRHKAVAVAGALTLFGGLALSGGIASANLNGSTFESTDANMVVNTPGNLDWINAPNRHIGTDQPSGALDNAFANGSHEDEVNVNVDHGSIPNSKADLGQFADSSQTIVGGPHDGEVMLYLAWTRNNTSGSTNFDFELNKVAQPDMTGAGNTALHLNRTVGDVLINYALQGGSQTPTLSRRVWSGTAWGPEIAFSPTVADGSTNTNVQIQNVLGGPANIPAAEFGEAAINMTAAGLIPNQNDPNAPCTAFGSVYVKSRSSQSFTSEIKDFIAPIGVNLSTCGNIIIKKVTNPSPDPTNTSFPFTLKGGTSNLNASFSLKNGEQNVTAGANVKVGSGYNAAEQTPVGWDLSSAVCDDGSPVTNIDVSVGETVTCTFTNNGRATIVIKKVTQPDPDPSGQGFDFSLNGTGVSKTFNLLNGQSNTTANLSPTSGYVAAETVPTGWTPLGAVCSDGSPVTNISLSPGEVVTCTFTNQHLGNIIIKKVTDPNPDPTNTNFPFVVSGTGVSDSFNEQNGGSHTTPNVPPGTYSANESTPTGWTLLNSSCDDGSPIGSISVSAGETVTCTFTNQHLASLHIIKKAERPGVSFDFTSTTLSPDTFSLSNGQTQDFTGLAPGVYDSAETVPAGWNLDSATCSNGDAPSAVTLHSGQDVTCTYTNVIERGAVLIHKTAKHAASGPGDHPLAGVTFTVTNATNGTNTTAVTNANGDACVSGLPVSVLDGTYNAHETVPAGYHGEADKTVTVVESTCASATATAVHNTPLTNVTVNVDSQIDGGTASAIDCGPGHTGTTGANGDGSVTVNNLEPTAPGVTLTCTITVDP